MASQLTTESQDLTIREGLWKRWVERGRSSDLAAARWSRIVFTCAAIGYAALTVGLYVTGHFGQ